MWERSTSSIIRHRFLGHQLTSIKHCYFFKDRGFVLTILLSPGVEVALAFNRRPVSVLNKLKKDSKEKAQVWKKTAKKKYKRWKGEFMMMYNSLST